jgi:hypothetical protein
MDIDKKFKFLAVNPCKVGVTYTEKDGIILLAKDNACVATLDFYYKYCKELGVDELQLEGITQLIERVVMWRSDNQDKCKVADTNECEGRNTIGGVSQ